jgi:hypothetical protein
MRNYFGFRWPNYEALYAILFSRFRGLFFFSPVLAWLFLEFLVRIARKKNIRHVILHPLFALTVVYLIIGCSYYMWWGGASYGPRHLIPLTMLLTFEAVRQYDNASQHLLGLLIFGSVGILLAFLAKATGVYLPSETFRDPLFQQILVRFEAGELSDNNALSLFFGIRENFAIWCWPAGFLASLLFIRFFVQRIYAPPCSRSASDQKHVCRETSRIAACCSAGSVETHPRHFSSVISESGTPVFSIEKRKG